MELCCFVEINHPHILHQLLGFGDDRLDLLRNIPGIENFITFFAFIAGNTANDQQTEAQLDGFGSHTLISGFSTPHTLHFASSLRVFQSDSHFSGLGA